LKKKHQLKYEQKYADIHRFTKKSHFLSKKIVLINTQLEKKLLILSLNF